MADRQVRMGQLLATTGLKRIMGNEIEGIKALDLNRLSATDVVRLIEVGVKIERLARGEPTEVTGVVDMEYIRRQAAAAAEGLGLDDDETEELIRRAEAIASTPRP